MSGPSVNARLETAFSVQPDAIHAMTVLLDRVPSYDAELISELLSDAGRPLDVKLLGLKGDPDRFLVEAIGASSKVYLIFRGDSYVAPDGGVLDGRAHVGIWPGSTIGQRLLSDLQGDDYVRPLGRDGEIALMSQLARRLLAEYGEGLVLNRADYFLKTKDEASEQLGGADAIIPFAAWLRTERVTASDGEEWLMTFGYEPFGLPDVAVRIDDSEELARSAVLYACWYLLENRSETLTHVPDRFTLGRGSAPKLGEGCSFLPVRTLSRDEPWRVRITL